MNRIGDMSRLAECLDEIIRRFGIVFDNQNSHRRYIAALIDFRRLKLERHGRGILPAMRGATPFALPTRGRETDQGVNIIK